MARTFRRNDESAFPAQRRAMTDRKAAQAAEREARIRMFDAMGFDGAAIVSAPRIAPAARAQARAALNGWI